jgi:6-phosphogluconate dehydrogenase
MKKSEFGVIGLGVMGTSISDNLLEKGFALSVYNRTENSESEFVKKFLENHRSFDKLSGFTDLSAFVESIQKPRKILLMISAGSAVDMLLMELLPELDENDIIIDGGNSHYLDTNRRAEVLASQKFNFVGCGISGGQEGAKKGPSLMPGGSKTAYKSLAPILESIAAKDLEGKPCCTYIGPEGAGHFVKMVHNGIEYAEMQLIAELYTLMKPTMAYSEISEVFSGWNSGELSSYLLGITGDILQKREGEHYLLDRILDKAASKGTGSWSSKAGLDLGNPNTMMSSAVFSRYLSSFKEKRVALSRLIKNKNTATIKPDLKILKTAYQFARIINHHQGFELIRLASEEYKWDINLSEIARIWTNGCIIKSGFMIDAIDILKANDTLFQDKEILTFLTTNESSMTKLIKYGLSNRIATDVFWSAYNYWISMTSEHLPANLIQAQRDYFGAHTYQRNDKSSLDYFHTNWSKE